MKTLFFLFLFSSICIGQPKDRLKVKNILDGFHPQASAKRMTVKELEKLPLVKVKSNTPRMESEKQLIQVTGKIMILKREQDGDLHCELSDGTCKDSTVAFEFPNPTLAKSPFNPQFKKARDFILTKKVGDTVTLIAPLFFDRKHGKTTNRIQNFAEGHPCLEAH